MKVLATGVKGEIASGLVRRLRNLGHTVELAERGDDLAKLAGDADALVVLEGTVPTGADYPMALRAAAGAVERTGIEHLVAVTLHPYTAEQRKGAFADGRRAEAALVRAGYPLIVIRAGVLVGSPDLSAPVDVALFSRGDTIRYPGDGSQRLRPLLLEDLGAVLDAALRAAPWSYSPSAADAARSGSQHAAAELDPWAVMAEGPATISVRELLDTLNPGVRPSPARRITAPLLVMGIALVAAVLVAGVAIDLPADALVPMAGALLGAVMSATAASWSGRFTPNALPADDFLLGGEEAPQPVLDVPLRKVTEVWDADAIRRRRPREELQRKSKRYAVTTGSYWVAGFLLVFAAGAATIGFHDLFLTGSGAGARLAALMLCLVASIAAFGGIALLTRWPSRYAVGFLASIVCVATLVIVPASSAAGGDPPGPLLFAAIYVIPAAVACCIRLWKRGALQAKKVLVTRGEKVFGSVVVGGSIATVVQLLYGSVYLPTTARRPSPARCGSPSQTWSRPRGTVAALAGC